jgi:CRP-like cAMP-binding protein
MSQTVPPHGTAALTGCRRGGEPIALWLSGAVMSVTRGECGNGDGAAWNRLLAALPADEWRRLEPQLEPVALRTKQLLLARDQPIEYVYFPENAVCSIVTVMADGETAESGTVGCDGFVGVDLALGTRTATHDTIVQVPGHAQRMATDAFLEYLRGSAPMRALLRRHVHALLVQSLQSTACNRLHTLLQRCCRWLLLTHDRAGRDEFRLTHDLLATMVGVRRPSITMVLRDLAAQGVVSLSRGCIVIVNRAGLEAQACECYAATRRTLRRVQPAATVRQRTDPAALTR